MQEHAYVVNVDIAVVDDDQYLFIERSQDKDHAAGMLAFPGGRVEQPPGGTETIEQTARRELSEEVGVEAESIEYIHSSTFEDDRGTRCLNIVTLCEHWEGEPTVNAPDEVASVQWLGVERIQDSEDIPPFLEAYVERIEQQRED